MENMSDANYDFREFIFQFLLSIYRLAYWKRILFRSHDFFKFTKEFRGSARILEHLVYTNDLEIVAYRYQHRLHVPPNRCGIWTGFTNERANERTNRRTSERTTTVWTIGESSGTTRLIDPSLFYEDDLDRRYKLNNMHILLQFTF